MRCARRQSASSIRWRASSAAAFPVLGASPSRRYNSSMVSVVQLRSQDASALDRSSQDWRCRSHASRARSSSPSRCTPGRRCPPASRCGRTRSASSASLAAIGMDPAARAAGVLFAVPKYAGRPEKLRRRIRRGDRGARRRRGEALPAARADARHAGEQNEILRKMVLGMVEDIRVVLIRLASRTQTLRWFAKNASRGAPAYARETLDIYCAARQPAGRLAAEVGAGGPVVPLPRARALQEHRADARRAARRARAVHRERHRRRSATRAAKDRRAGRGHRPAEAHLLHLEQDARQEPRLRRGARRARAARHRARR